MSEMEKDEESKWTIKQKCAECFNGPKKILKTLIILVCSIIVLQQITACVQKLIVIPVTTYTHFDFNKTLLYPSVTFCRDPPYKYGKLQDEESKWTIKQKCAECFNGPKKILKTLIILVCSIIVLQQITACVQKLIVIPVTTYTHFDFNKTLLYPSVTFCRDPPYKYGKLQEYGIRAGHPEYTSAWLDFNFNNMSLDDLWEEITFNEKDIFVNAALDSDPENVDLQPIMGFMFGRCYTMVPKILGTKLSTRTGYSVILQHTAEDIATTTSTIPPGYHVFIHYTNEPFTEVMVYNGGLVDKLYVNVGETLSIKLKVDQYLMIGDDDNPCVTEKNYSTNNCTTQYVWNRVEREVGCSGPWMRSKLPRCNNYDSMNDLIAAYINLYSGHKSEVCPRTCHTYLYNGYVTDRQKFYTWDNGSKTWSIRSDFSTDSALQTLLYISFNSMMVSVYEERYNYDWNLFLSDLGGSVGFLLGLSVIGLLELFGKIWSIFVEPLIKTKKKKGTSVSSDETADVKTKQQYIEEWTAQIN